MAEKALVKITTTYMLSKFLDPTTGFCINLYKDTESGESVTCKGNFLPDVPRIRYSMSGYWKDAGKYGKNFIVENYNEVIETTKEGIVTYLSSGIIKGIGQSTAEKIYRRFGNDSLRIIEEDPAKLLDIKGISQGKVNVISKSYKEKRFFRDIIEFLLPFGITPKQSMKIINQLNIHSVLDIKKNPYRLFSVSGISIQCVDLIAKKVSYPVDSMERLRAHSIHVLKEKEMNGHTACEANDFGRAVVHSLNCSCFNHDNICNFTIQMIKDGFLRHCKVERDGQTISLISRNNTFNAELSIAKNLFMLLQHKQPEHNNVRIWIEENCKRDGISLDENQMTAIESIINNSCLIVTGRPGTGKTTIIKQAAEYLEENERDRELYFMAPSGRAARRINESTGFFGRTIHSTYGLLADEETNSEFADREVIKLENATIFCDECSMIGIFLMATITERIVPGCRFILIGDENQLPSVECGSLLRDLIASKKIPMIRLSKIHRQAENSNICLNSRKIEKGEADLLTGKDFQIIQSKSSSEAQEKIVQHYLNYVNTYGIESVYCIVPRKEGIAGVKALNATLQDNINPAQEGILDFQYKGITYRIGDPVMQLKNHEDIANGDIGYVTRIYVDEDEGVTIEVTYFGSLVVKYTTDNVDEITLAYAFTIHKAQGSENKIVLTYLSGECGRRMLKKNLLYTAITRGKQMVELFLTNDSALNDAIHNDDSAYRLTSLQYQMIRVFGGWISLT